MKKLLILLFIFSIVACHSIKRESNPFLEERTPNGVPISFMPALVNDSLIIHRGIFSNDLQTYYYTISDKAFSRFDILTISRKGGDWSAPREAFFNSSYSDHGMSFSPDGKTLVFSSTRPVAKSDIPDTWHLWKCEKNEEVWSTPQYIEIPDMQSKLLSHPTIAPDGSLYFHASNLDYSDMAIYHSFWVDGKYEAANKMDFGEITAYGFCTPYVSSDGKRLIFAAIGESLELYQSEMSSSGEWSPPVVLPSVINQNGQGNPYLTPDSKYLFFAKESGNGQSWEIQWINTSSFMK